MKQVTTVTIEMVGFNPILLYKDILCDAVANAINSFEEEEGIKTFGNVSFRVDAKTEGCNEKN